MPERQETECLFDLWWMADIVSSFTYINEMDENITGDLEALTIRTIGKCLSQVQGTGLIWKDLLQL
jgi:hypothetical protein